MKSTSSFATNWLNSLPQAPEMNFKSILYSKRSFLNCSSNLEVKNNSSLLKRGTSSLVTKLCNCSTGKVDAQCVMIFGNVTNRRTSKLKSDKINFNDCLFCSCNFSKG